MNIKVKELTRRGFVKKAAVAGAAVVLGAALKPALKAFSDNGSPSYNVNGEWRPTTC